MKFLVDEMFQRLGRWLRAAGYDVVIIQDGRDDSELLEQAIKEDRLLLTADRELARRRRARQHVIVLEHESLSASIKSLSQQCPINWLYKPFSRCMVCNTLLQAPPGGELSIPENIKNSGQLLVYCQVCDRVYWEGSHVKRMHRQLIQFNEFVAV